MCVLAADEDAKFVRRNTQEQNQNLDIVGGAAADIKRLAYVSLVWLFRVPPKRVRSCAHIHVQRSLLGSLTVQQLLPAHLRVALSPHTVCCLPQGIEAEAQRQMPPIDSTLERLTDARVGVRDNAKKAFNYRTGR